MLKLPDTRSESTYRVWDLVQHVEENPEDYPERWRLAKKLYAAWEYDLALEHLLVLKEEWDRKLNVLRYLAATYYRLGRYEDSIAELKVAIKLWPREMGPREQLARVQEAAGLRAEAAETWRRIQEMDPHHPIAKSAQRRLTADTGPPTPQNDLHIGDSDSGIDLSPGQVCPNCGAQNSDEFERCWQCHGRLGSRASSGSRSRPGKEQDSGEVTQIAVALALVGVLSLCFYLSLNLLLAWHAQEVSPKVLTSLQELYDKRLGLTRVLCGIAMVVGAPMLLGMAIGLAKPERPVSVRPLRLAGMLVAASAFALTWVNLSQVPLALGAAALVWLALLLWLAPLPRVKSVQLWLTHVLLMVGVVLATFAAAENWAVGGIFNPFSDLPAVVRYAQADAENAENVVQLPAFRVPLTQQNLVWESTGSAWLDRRAGPTEFRIQAGGDITGMKFELEDLGGTERYEEVTQANWSLTTKVVPGQPYEVHVTGIEGVPVAVWVAGLLRLATLRETSMEEAMQMPAALQGAIAAGAPPGAPELPAQ